MESAATTSHRNDLSNAQTRSALLDDKGRYLRFRTVGGMCRKDSEQVRHRRVGNVALRAVEDVRIAAPDSGRLQRGRVRACTFFRQGIAPCYPPTCEARQPTLTLCLGAVQFNSLRGDMDVHAIGVKIRDVRTRHFLDSKAISQHIEAESAVALRRVAAVQAKGANCVERLRRYLSILLDRRIMRFELSLDELAEVPSKRTEVFRNRKIHCCSLCVRSNEHSTQEYFIKPPGPA